MTNRVDLSSVTAVPALSAPAPATGSTDTTGATSQHAPEARPKETEAVALDVVRGAGGEFVYTLTDSTTGRLLAVIPGNAEKRTAGNYASGGWVSLTA